MSRRHPPVARKRSSVREPERVTEPAPASGHEPLRVLFVEDRAADVELSLIELRKAGFDVTADTVESREAFATKLRTGKYDVVLSDYRLPGWTGMDAFDEMFQPGRRIPFILVTGSLGEEAAVDCVKRGVTDYVLKDRLARLPVALRQALEQRRLRNSEALAVNALESSEERYRNLVENSTDAVLLMSEERWVFANRAAVRLFGGARQEDLVGRAVLDSVEPALHEEVLRRIRHSLLTGEVNPPIERRLVRLDGSLIDVDVLAIPSGDGASLMTQVIMRDITARKQMEEALQEREERFREITENMREAFFMLKADLSEVLYISPAFEVILGRRQEPAELNLQVFFGAIHPDDRVQVMDDLAGIREGGEIVGRTFRVVRPGGEIRWVLGRTVAVRDSSGEIYRLAGVLQDVTEERAAQENLRRSEAEYRGLVEHAPLGIYRSTTDGRFLTVNPALIRMLGYRWAEEMLSLDMARDVYAHPEQRGALIAQLGHLGDAQTETDWKRKDGSAITVRLNVRTVRGQAGEFEFFEGLVEDVTEQRSLESQFRQAQRMEAVGRLAGGVAHDFNNILTAITGYSELLLEDLGATDPKRSDVEEIKAAAARATALTRQLLAFSRKQILQTQVLDLNEVVRTLDKMLLRLVGEDVKVELALAKALGAVRADPGQIEQVLLNLAVNSRDAMPNGGNLTIETANVDLDAAYVREHAGASTGSHVMLAVSDTGIGMNAETRTHIFEPFFTTKEQGKGTGLGLSTVYGIVKQSGGSVWVYSEPGRGATFKVYLPRVEEPLEVVARVSADQLVSGGGETVLLAEDDPSVRAVVSEVLAQKGYRVMRAPDGQAALEMARGHPAEIRLLITDIVMPGMTGRDLAEALKAERPGLRVLYMSGYTDDAVVRHGVLEEGMPYLQKPFSPRALASKVREVLDQT